VVDLANEETKRAFLRIQRFMHNELSHINRHLPEVTEVDIRIVTVVDGMEVHVSCHENFLEKR